MKVLALERPVEGRGEGIPPSLLEEEARVLYNLSMRGIVRETYFRADRREAVLVLECEGTAEAENALERLPLVREGLIRFEVVPLRPYDGFGRLIRT